jgi:hypothetical protein
MQYVRNTTIHGVFIDFLADEPFWHLRSKDRELTKAQLFSCEELINTAHVAEGFPHLLGGQETACGTGSLFHRRNWGHNCFYGTHCENEHCFHSERTENVDGLEPR